MGDLDETAQAEEVAVSDDVVLSDQEEFFEAARTGDLAKVEELISAEPGLFHARDEQGRTGLLIAVYQGQHEAVNLLVERMPQIDVWEAAASGHVERVHEILREEPGQADFTSPDGFAPLGLAAFFGHADVVEVLARAGVDVNARSKNAMQVCPIHSAAAHSSPEVALEMCRILLEYGGDPTLRQTGGWTPLHQAAAHGNLPLVLLLLEHGARADSASDDGRTPLDMAREGGHAEVVERLRSS